MGAPGIAHKNREDAGPAARDVDTDVCADDEWRDGLAKEEGELL